VRADIGKAQTRLQAELGADVNESPRLFAYAYGEYDTALAALVRQMRYIPFGQHSGAVARLDGPAADALPRFAMAERYAGREEFAQKVATRALPVARVTPSDPRRFGSDPPTLEVTLAAEGWRDRVSCYYDSQRLGVKWLDATRFTTRAARPLETGRNRYNCTARDAQGHWYWLSQPFLK
jgi:hypothetical protein